MAAVAAAQKQTRSLELVPLPWYTLVMAMPTLEKQLAPVAQGRKNIADLQTGQGKVIVLSQKMGDRFRTVLEYMAQQISDEPPPRSTNGWTDAKNARRVELINKKHNGGLTAAERKELRVLQADVERYAEQVAPLRNDILELLLIGLQQKAAQRKKSKR